MVDHSDPGQLRRAKHIFVTEVVEHRPALSNMLWQALLETVAQPAAMQMVRFMTDCGNHFRSYCNLHFTAVVGGLSCASRRPSVGSVHLECFL